MTDPIPPAPDPLPGLDPEVLEILAARQQEQPPGSPPGTPPSGSRPSDPAVPPGPGGQDHPAGGPARPTGRHRRSAWGAALTMAAVVVAGAALDPSGLAAPVAWSGARPAALPWTWLQYVLLAPGIVVLVGVGTLLILRGAVPAAPRRWVLTRVWLLVVLAMMTAKLGYSGVLMAPALLGGAADGLPPGTSLPYLVWATGFTGIKALLLGWLPGLVAALLWAPGRPRRAGEPREVEQPTLGLGPAAVVVLVLALVGGWTAQHWWLGSPVGYAHTTDWRLLAPVASGGRVGWLLALAAVWLLMAASLRATLRRVALPRPPATRALAGAVAAVAALLALAAVQSLVALVGGTDLPGGDDLWILPSTYLRLAEALSFALLLAPVAALASWLVPRAPRVQWSWVAAVGAVAVAIGALVLVVRAGDARTPVAPLAGSDPAPVELPAQPAPVAGELAPPARLTVRRDADGAAVLSDQAGAQVILRGVNVNQLNEYYAADPAVRTVEPLSEQDFADIAAMGFNAVRLTMSWSALEPERGTIDGAYLDRIKRAVGWARTHGIHVVLDMHQDAWGMSVAAPEGTTCRRWTEPMTGWDGAPAWASLDDGAPPCQFTGRDLAPNVLRTFTSFYTDREGIGTRLVAVWERLAREFAGDPTIAGYDLLNEPSFAEQAPLTSALLGRYAARAIAAIRAGEAAAPDGYPHPVFLEPSIWWSGFGVDPLPPRGFVTDPQVVFSPHLYNESITVDQSLGITTVSIERGYALAQRAARAWGVPLWSGEWGSFGDARTNRSRYERFTAAEDALRVGSAIWVWKQACGDPHAYPSEQTGNIRVVSCPDGTPLPSDATELEPLRRAYPRAAPGRIVAIRSEGRRVQVDGDTGGVGAVDGTPDGCRLDVWVPGAAEPTIVDTTNVRDLRAVSVPSGSPVQGPSGGWRVIGCAQGPYRITLS